MARSAGVLTGNGPSWAMLWVVNRSDGGHTLWDIAQRSSLSFDVVAGAGSATCGVGLIKENSIPAGSSPHLGLD